jgi:hypothetical protein
MFAIENIKTETIEAGLEHVVDRIVRQYEEFHTAFQKEAIQNAWDARLDRKHAKDWKIKVDLFKEPHSDKQHLIIEDFHTYGMDKERWRAFLALWKPKKEDVDAGGQGQGKFVLMGASKDHILFVESKDPEFGYSCRYLRGSQKNNPEYKIDITEEIQGSEHLNHRGTKVWIYDVRKEFLQSILSQNFYHNIAATWWQLFQERFFNAKIYLFGKLIRPLKLPQVKESKIVLENYEVKDFGRIKRLVLEFYEEDIPELCRGVRVQRANMMITRIPFNIYDKDFKNRFSGFIEFDKNLSKILKEIEKTDHCNFAWESPWREIKGLIDKEIEKFKDSIIPKKEKTKSVISTKQQNEIINRVNQIVLEHLPDISKLTGSAIPTIVPKEPPECRIESLLINKRQPKYNDIIKPKCTIKNTSNHSKKVILKTILKFHTGREIDKEEHLFRIKPGRLKKLNLSEIDLNKTYSKGKYTIRAILKQNSHDIHSKATSFYLEVERPHIKSGFVKKFNFEELGDATIRNTPINKGSVTVNPIHPDFRNIFNSFEPQKRKRTLQINFYIMKILLDEAVRTVLRLKISKNQELNEEFLNELLSIRDRMYYEVFI